MFFIIVSGVLGVLQPLFSAHALANLAELKFEKAIKLVDASKKFLLYRLYVFIEILSKNLLIYTSIIRLYIGFCQQKFSICYIIETQINKNSKKSGKNFPLVL